jgi:hypothetical protein
LGSVASGELRRLEHEDAARDEAMRGTALALRDEIAIDDDLVARE